MLSKTINISKRRPYKRCFKRYQTKPIKSAEAEPVHPKTRAYEPVLLSPTEVVTLTRRYGSPLSHTQIQDSSFRVSLSWHCSDPDWQHNQKRQYPEGLPLYCIFPSQSPLVVSTVTFGIDTSCDLPLIARR